MADRRHNGRARRWKTQHSGGVAPPPPPPAGDKYVDRTTVDKYVSRSGTDTYVPRP